MSKEKLRENAKTLKQYMDFRAKKENLENELDEKFFNDSFENGVFTLFGIECNPENGEIIKDNQNPEAYKEFNKKETLN